MAPYALSIVTDANAEPVTVAEVKLHTRIDSSFEDTLLTTWIRSAREQAEAYQKRSYVTKTYDLFLDDWPCNPFVLPRSPVSAITHVKYYGTDGTAYTFYESGSTDNLDLDLSGEPARLALAYSVSWPSTTLRSLNGVSIRFVSGYGPASITTPDTVRDAIMLYCDWRYENRTAESGEAPRQFWDLLRPSRVPNV